MVIRSNISGSLIACGIYYFVWASLLPKWRGYALRQEVLSLDNGAQTHQLVKVPIEEIEVWDASHDALGRLREGHTSAHYVQEKTEAELSNDGDHKTTLHAARETGEDSV